MSAPPDPASLLRNRIARRRVRVARWGKEGAGVEDDWTGGREYRAFCRRMATAARDEMKELEAELRQVQAAEPHAAPTSCPL